MRRTFSPFYRQTPLRCEYCESIKKRAIAVRSGMKNGNVAINTVCGCYQKLYFYFMHFIYRFGDDLYIIGVSEMNKILFVILLRTRCVRNDEIWTPSKGIEFKHGDFFECCWEMLTIPRVTRLMQIIKSMVFEVGGHEFAKFKMPDPI